MCTVTFIPREDGFYVAMNRDERIARPFAKPPALFGEGFVRSMYPLDCEGGTWIAANQMGIAFTLLNWNDAPVLHKKSRTRGHVIPALVSSNCSRSAELVLGKIDMDGVLPFRLIGIFPNEERVVEWAWNQRSIERNTFRWRPTQWCSSSLSDAIATVARGLVFEEKLAARNAGSLRWLRQLHASHDNDSRFSHCVHRETVGTVSYTELVCSDESIECKYRAGNPCSLHMNRHGTNDFAVCAQSSRIERSVGNTSRISETDSHNPVLGSSRLNADDRLSLGLLGSVEGGNRIVEGSHIADVYPQPTTPDSLGELT